MLRLASRLRVRVPHRGAFVSARFYSSNDGAKTAQNPWEELFASPDVGDTPEITPEEAPPMLRSALHARERPNTRRHVRTRNEYDTSMLTHAESQQFRRIFQLLEEEMGQEAPKRTPFADDGLELFAARNALAPRKMTARGGGVGTRFQAVQEGAAASVAPDVMERGVDAIWEALQAQPDASAAWAWAEMEVWGTREHEPSYGPSTPFFAPALHMLVLTLRDRLHTPHAALAVVPTTRALGATAYVLGCTAALYAEVIRTQWLCLHDLYAVLATVREARQAGVLADLGDADVSPAAFARRDDAPLREHIDRIRNEARSEVMRRVEAGPSIDEHLSGADRDVLRVTPKIIPTDIRALLRS
ncbi:hypothetical protein MOBT1_000217 [Malassezia obtusa]|uniref:Mtf2-like C-terminal domain-containing protein n=1 Tax=Malassezia obtusa TaxID=76774 RepID=A0AAF0IRW6_9BASI|nr:hypothetical protein MOBT1_000217 [Malassezia obtusa]